MRKIIPLLFSLLLCGCNANAAPAIESDTVYSTVTSASGSNIVVRDDNSGKETDLTLNDTIVILKGDKTASPSDIKPKDHLMCTYTAGQLSVIQVLSGS